VFKPALAELAVEKLAPIAAEMRRISDDRAYVDAVLRDGGEGAGALGGATKEDGGAHKGQRGGCKELEHFAVRRNRLTSHKCG
jgi:hypothetical protein